MRLRQRSTRYIIIVAVDENTTTLEYDFCAFREIVHRVLPANGNRMDLFKMHRCWKSLQESKPSRHVM